MKKRMLCLLLAVLTLLPLLAAPRASAASLMKTSEAGIALLKEFEGFVQYAMLDQGQYYIGYGSGCRKDDYPNGITEAQADALLRQHLTSMEKSVNLFLDRYGLVMSQHQFDALMIFTYNVGVGWRNSEGAFRSAVINGAKGNDFIYPITLWSQVGSDVVKGLVKRRLAEANLYLNGVYSKEPPANYTYVILEGNEGVSSVKVQGYDASSAVTPKPIPVRTGFRFMGWYTAEEGGAWVHELTAATGGQTLYAHWQEGEGDPEKGTAVSYQRSLRNLVSLEIYSAPGGKQVTGKLSGYETVRIVADYVDASGIKWGRLSQGGWVNLGNAIVGIVTNHDTEEPVEVTVTTDNVNVRSGPGTTYQKVGTVNEGDKLTILQTQTYGDHKWGRFKDGWISLMYTDYDQVLQAQIGDGSKVVAVGKVVNCHSLRIRSGPGTNYAMLGSLNVGAQVEITQIKVSGGMNWGKIPSGWISMSYVQLIEEDPQPGETDSEVSEENDYVTVTHGALNVRKGPGASYPKVGMVYYEQRFALLEVKNVEGNYWGRIDGGWICLTYTDYKAPVQGLPEEEPEDKPEDDPEETTPDGAVTGTVITHAALRIRSGPGTQYGQLGCYYYGDKIQILESKTVSGQSWGRTDKGWVCLDYVKLDQKLPDQEPEKDPENEPEPEKDPNVPYSGVITADGVRIRDKAGTGSRVLGYYWKGEKVEILETASASGLKWGRTQDGWFCLDYVSAASQEPEEDQPEPEKPDPEQPEDTGKGESGTVSCSGEVNIRSGPGTTYEKVGTYPQGTRVTILEQKTVSGMKWGRTDKGWICMAYVTLDSDAVFHSYRGEINANGVRIRSAAGTNSRVVAYYRKGDLVEILETQKADNKTWGRTVHGWVSLEFVDKK